MAGYGKNDKEVTSGGYGANDKLVEDTSGISRGESALRGFSSGATLGLGNKIQAYLRAIPIHLEPGENGLPTIAKDRDNLSYLERARMLEDEERLANSKAAMANPGSYAAGNIAGALPSAANVAGLARSAGKVAGSQALGSALTGAGAGGTYGAIQGVGSSKSDFSDLPENVAKNAAIGATTGAVTGGVTGKLMDRSQASLMSKLGGGGEGASPMAIPAAVKDLSAWATGGALGNIGLNRYSNNTTSSYKTDAPGALAEDALAGLVGAGTGAAARIGVGALGKVADKALPWIGQQVNKLGLPSAVNDTILGAPSAVANQTMNKQAFGGIVDYLKQAQGANNPAVEQAAQQAQQLTDQESKRKAAMALNSTPTGRAVGNSTSPLRDEDDERNR